jgi:hypothetical protein
MRFQYLHGQWQTRTALSYVQAIEWSQHNCDTLTHTPTKTSTTYSRTSTIIQRQQNVLCLR